VKLIKMLGLTAVAALAAMAFVGANTASADVACLESGHHTSECPAGQIWTGGIKGVTSAAVLLGADKVEVVEKCSSEVKGTATSSEGSHVGLTSLVTIAFSGCTGLCPSADPDKPAILLVAALTLTGTILEDGTQGRPSALLLCAFGATCLYDVKASPTPTMALSGNTLTATNIALERLTGICPATTFWDASYTVTKDAAGGAAVFIAALP
jgi:hypothetical protein